MEITVFMTLPQANLYRVHSPFSDGFIRHYKPTVIHAHYISIPSLKWDGWDNLNTISRDTLPQLTYEEFLDLPQPITEDVIKSLYPEYFI